MSNQIKINLPKVKAFKLPIKKNGNPEITDIHYDLWTLKITLNFERQDYPTYLIFENVVGFRVLDEGDLLEFWNPEVRIDDWIWEIQEGGWTDLEKCRKGFLSATKSTDTEYFVCGINECLNVITNEHPKIYEPNN
ncbi:MAG: hypothetical protein GY931_04700 [Maribacter sp.]|nr:hypothetical protein [Maribacter sp.]